MTYKTKQKEKIIDLIKKQNHAFTIKDIYDKLDHQIGMTTIYRMIDKLVIDNRLNKTIGKNNITYYEYLELCPYENHFYLKCQNCGLLIHIDCDCVNDLFSHITSNHDFLPESKNIIINGTCKLCGGK